MARQSSIRSKRQAWIWLTSCGRPTTVVTSSEHYDALAQAIGVPKNVVENYVGKAQATEAAEPAACHRLTRPS